jgi:predicted lipid-binding transport protein (Tim44 family)
MKSDLIVVVAGIACLITFFVVRRILRDQLKLGLPGLLAGAIAALAFLGLCGSGDGLVAALLIPYATLALALLILFLLFWLLRYVPSRFNRGPAQNEADGWDSKRPRSSSPNAAPSSQPAHTRLHQFYAPLPGAKDLRTHDAQAPGNDETTL